LKLHRLFFSSLLLIALALSGCSPQESSNSAAAVKREVSLAAVSAQAKGFSVGALMSTNIVYVFFDAQCPHCGRLWEASAPLHRKVKFVWIPVGLINATSTAQGAALLTAANPGALMTEHEASLLAGKGGISASSSIAPEVTQAIKNNTQMLNSFGAESVPFVVAKNLKTGQTVSQEGALSTAALAEFLGVDAP
jgi:thiol:disulfide interchange protein DsbG